MKEERKNILRKLMHTQKMAFNQLWAKEGESNNFAYHLKVLEDDGLIEKNKNNYSLTKEGKKQVAYFEGSTGNLEKAPLLAVAIVVFDNKKNKYLILKRTKEPFYGYFGFPAGKLRFNQYVLEAAEDELKQESGLSADLELKGLYSSKTYNESGLAFNHQIFIVKGTNPKGKLLKKTREGECFWHTKDEIKKLKIFPNIPDFINICERKGFGWLEQDRNQVNDEFKSVKTHKNLKL